MFEVILALIVLYILSSYIIFIYPTLLHCPKKKAAFIPQHISHRGGAGERTENTMEAFKNAVSIGTDMLELDCHLTKDGEVVVIHDSDLERATGTKAEIHELNYAELPLYLPDLEVQFKPECRCQIPKEADRRILRLEDLFKAFPTIPMNIDIKVDDDRLISKVAQLVHQYGREQVTVWGSFDAAVSEKCKLANPNIARFFPLRPTVCLLLANAIGLSSFMSLPYDYLELPLVSAFDYQQFRAAYNLDDWKSRIIMWLAHWFIMSPRLFRHLKARGIPVIFWVCNSEKDYQMAYDVGAVGCMTDYPKHLRSFLDRNRTLQANIPVNQQNGLSSKKFKRSNRIEQKENDTVLTKLSSWRPKRSTCRTSASTALAHTGGDLLVRRD